MFISISSISFSKGIDCLLNVTDIRFFGSGWKKKSKLVKSRLLSGNVNGHFFVSICLEILHFSPLVLGYRSVGELCQVVRNC
jgi:hypothetical protein